MENFVNKKLDEVINCIINSDDYKKCILLKEKMAKSEDITSLVDSIKKLQKQYVNTHDDYKLLEVKKLEKELNEIPLYVSYMEHLERVNQMINYVKDELNDYFYHVLNDQEVKLDFTSFFFTKNIQYYKMKMKVRGVKYGSRREA